MYDYMISNSSYVFSFPTVILPKLTRAVEDITVCSESSTGLKKLILKYFYSGIFMKPVERKGDVLLS